MNDRQGTGGSPGERLTASALRWTDVADAIWLALAQQPRTTAEPETPSAAEATIGTSAQGLDQSEPARTADGVETLETAHTADEFPLPAPQTVDQVLLPETGHPMAPDLAIGLAPLSRSSRSALPLRDAAGLSSLRRPLAVGRDLEIDEEKTAARGLEDDLWLPFGRPGSERHLSLTLIIDRSPSMEVWAPSIRLWCAAFARTGFFRDVRTVHLAFIDDSRPVLRPERSEQQVSPTGLVDPTGRRAFLVLTDGIAPGWASCADELLTTLGRSGPTALVHMLRREQWRWTPIEPYVAEAMGGFAVPNSRLKVRDSRRYPNPFRPLPAKWNIAVPVLGLTGRALKRWGGLVSGTVPGWQTTNVLLTDSPDRSAGSPGQAGGSGGSGVREDSGALGENSETRVGPWNQDFDAAVLVARFRTHATPVARRLAAHIAAAPFDLDLIRDLQAQLLPLSRPEHLAELFLHGLVKTRPRATPAVGQSMDFVAGVREQLLALATRPATARVVQAVAQYYGPQSSYGRTTLSALEHPDQTPLPSPTPDNAGHIRTELAVMRALSGPHSARAARLTRIVDDIDRAAGTHDPSHSTTRVVSGIAQESGCEDHRETNAEADELEVVGPDMMQERQAQTAYASSEPQTVDEPLEQPGQVPTGQARIMNNVPPRNPNFTGREELLAQVEQQLKTSSTAAVLPHALHGMGGVGKSQIAIEYVYRHQHEYDIVWWIAAEQEGLILGALAELAGALSLPVSQTANTAVPAVREALRKGEPFGKWLLVFDNAENIGAVRPYFPTGGPGKILVTSRNREWERSATTLSVDVFQRAESTRLLQKRAKDITLEDADRLAAALGDLPLAIEQAAAWHAATAMSVDEYLGLLAQQSPAVLDLDPAPDYPVSVAKVFTLSLEQLRERNPAALELLQVCAFFAPEPIPRSLLRGSRTVEISAELDVTLRDPIRLGRAIRDINILALAKLEHRSDTLQLHRLVQAVLAAGMTDSEADQMRHGAHLLLASANPGAPSSPAEWPRYLAIQPHLIVSDAVRCSDPWVREAIQDSVAFLYFWGAHDAAVSLARQALASWQNQSGENNPQVLRISKWLAFVQRLFGEYREAAALGESILARYRELVGDDNEETLDAMTQMANMYRTKGDFKAALEMDEQAFGRCTELFGDEDPTTLQAAHGVGVSLRHVGDFRRALELDTQTWERWVLIYGEKHDRTLNTRAGVVIDRREIGEYSAAYADYADLYRVLVEVYGVDNASTVRNARDLAVSSRRVGNFDRAYALTEETLLRFENRYGPTYPDTLATAINAVVDRRLTGDLAGSQELGTLTLQRLRDTLGDEHSYTLSTRVNLAATLRAAGDLQAAFAHDQEAVTVFEHTLGPNHLLTLTARLGLANDRYQLHEYEEAERIDSAVHAQLAEIRGPEHPQTLSAEANLALDLRALGRIDEADRRRGDALNELVLRYGDAHPLTAAVRGNLRVESDIAPLAL